MRGEIFVVTPGVYHALPPLAARVAARFAREFEAMEGGKERRLRCADCNGWLAAGDYYVAGFIPSDGSNAVAIAVGRGCCDGMEDTEVTGMVAKLLLPVLAARDARPLGVTVH